MGDHQYLSKRRVNGHEGSLGRRRRGFPGHRLLVLAFGGAQGNQIAVGRCGLLLSFFQVRQIFLSAERDTQGDARALAR